MSVECYLPWFSTYYGPTWNGLKADASSSLGVDVPGLIDGGPDGIVGINADS
jgi:hypothetical protein